MNRQKIFFIIISFVVFGSALAVAAILMTHSAKEKKLSAKDNSSFSGAAASPVISYPSLSGNAFRSDKGDDVVLPQIQNNGALSLSITNSSSVSSANAHIAQIVPSNSSQITTSSTTSAQKPPTTVFLALPDVPDSEITIEASGVSTTLSYLTYFNTHAKDIAFDVTKFNNVLKDKYGIVLVAPALVEKAIADKNFSEITSSLAVQEEFTEAEIKFLKSMPVAGTAIAVNKENIGMEELTVNLINQALAVSAGSVQENNFINYYNQFAATTASARQNFVDQSGLLSRSKPANLFDRILGALGIRSVAKAQIADIPFGGLVSLVTPCPCDLGFNVTVGPPSPSSVFVPEPFLETPLFFDFKTMLPGTWWLGLNDWDVLVPCGEAPACEPVNLGAEVIIVGTSLPAP